MIATLAGLAILFGATTACASQSNKVDSIATVVAAFKGEGVKLTVYPVAALNLAANEPKPLRAFDAIQAGTPTSSNCGSNCGKASISISNVFIYVYRSSDDAREAMKTRAPKLVRQHNVLAQYNFAPPPSWLAKIKKALARL
jgi:hypothetical protein